MTRDWFEGCYTLQDLKKRYHELAKLHHPDIGGDLETMKQINAQYDDAVKNIGCNQHHRDYKAAQQENTQEFYDIISRLVKLQGIIVELVGTWIWVTGETRRNKDALKAAGMKWAAKKAAWYWHRAEDGVTRRSHMTLDQIRDHYGSKILHDSTNADGLQTA